MSAYVMCSSHMRRFIMFKFVFINISNPRELSVDVVNTAKCHYMKTDTVIPRISSTEWRVLFAYIVLLFLYIEVSCK